MSDLVREREAAPGQDGQPGQPGPPGQAGGSGLHRWHRWILLPALILGVAACLVGLSVRWLPAGPPATVTPARHAAASGAVTGVVHVAPSTNQVRGNLAFPEVNGIADGLGRLWLTGGDSGENHVVYAVNPASSRVDARVDLPSRLVINPNDIATGSGAVWAAVGTRIYRIAPASTGAASGGAASEAARAFAALPPGGLIGDLVVDAGAVWATDATSGKVYRFSASTGRLQAVVTVGVTAGALAVGDGGVWVADGDAHTVSRISVTRNRVDSVLTVPGVPGGMAASAHGLWVTDGAAGVVTFLGGPSGRRLAVPVGGEPTGIAVSGDTVWVASTARGTLSRIDARRHVVVATVPVGARPYAVAADRRGVWVTVLGKPVMMHTSPGSSSPSRGGGHAAWQTWLERLCGQGW